MLPQIAQLELNNSSINESPVTHKSLLWDFEAGDFKLQDGKVKEIESLEYIRVWIEKALRTRLGTLIYNTYGSGHQALIGRVLDREYAQSELERSIREALLQNEAITAATNFIFEYDGELLSIRLTVSTIYGDSEVLVNA